MLNVELIIAYEMMRVNNLQNKAYYFCFLHKLCRIYIVNLQKLIPTIRESPLHGLFFIHIVKNTLDKVKAVFALEHFYGNMRLSAARTDNKSASEMHGSR